MSSAWRAGCSRSTSRRAIGSRSGRPSRREWALVQLAAARAGAVLVILDGDWTSEQLLAIFREASVRLLVTAGSERLAQLAAVRSELACSSAS